MDAETFSSLLSDSVLRIEALSVAVLKTVLRFRKLCVFITQLLLVVLSNYLAFTLRFEQPLPLYIRLLFADTLGLLIAVRAAAFAGFHLHQGLWRYTSLWDLRNIIAAVTVSSLGFYAIVHSILGLAAYPRSIFILDGLVLTALLGGVRLGRRMLREFSALRGQKRVLIYGAGDAGELIVRDMKNNSDYQYDPIGFIDDDESKVGQRIHGIKVLGTGQNIGGILNDTKPEGILIAMPRIDSGVVRRIVRSLEGFNVRIQKLPDLRNVLDRTLTVRDIKDLVIEDLLDRAPVGLDLEPIRQLISGRRVLVTGAGGSIGSELCRQIATFGPKLLVMVERYENSLYAVANDVSPILGACAVPVVADVSDEKRVVSVLSSCQPELIFHAAAHKHVPLMEENPCEAIKNNVMGTMALARHAVAAGVSRFIFISTDKAVNPSSVMGASKRLAELILLKLNASARIFTIVRFGNVLGSNGSVVPRFVEQIRRGGPVTVTHPDMKRFFMLIPEAVQLVLQAACISEGEMFILEMGEQIRIVDMVTNLIRLSGLRKEDIPITYVGCRPGEKLYEELTGENENVRATKVLGVLEVTSRESVDAISLERTVSALKESALVDNADRVKLLLQGLFPSLAGPADATHDRRTARAGSA